MQTRWLVPAALLVGAKALGLLTLGLVTTGSMVPALPPGTLFLGVAASPEVGDVIVFNLPDGRQAVHRVVDRTPEGLITQGDANPRTDQEAGIPPVDPDDVLVVPTVAGVPLAIQDAWMKPAGVMAAQVTVLTFAVRGLGNRDRLREAGWPLRALRPHHLVVLAGVLLLVAGPQLHDQVSVREGVEVQGLLVPTVVRVETSSSVEHRLLAPLDSTTVPVDDPQTVDVVRAPALPGAAALAAHGGAWAMLPSSLATWTLALLLRRGGW